MLDDLRVRQVISHGHPLFIVEVTGGAYAARLQRKVAGRPGLRYEANVAILSFKEQLSPNTVAVIKGFATHAAAQQFVDQH